MEQWVLELPIYFIGIASLLAAAFLLVNTVLLRRVAKGGAIAENISFLILGIACLAASVLSRWIVEQLSIWAEVPQPWLASDGLVLLAMVFMGLYFWKVRKSLQGYLTAAQEYAKAAEANSAEELQDA